MPVKEYWRDETHTLRIYKIQNHPLCIASEFTFILFYYFFNLWNINDNIWKFNYGDSEQMKEKRKRRQR